MSAPAPAGEVLPVELEQRVRAALDEVVDPCSLGRSVPAGLVDMGMVCDVSVVGQDGADLDVRIELRTTSPGCAFQMYFDEQVKARVALLDGIGRITIDWNADFDWTDDDMSAGLKERLRARRAALRRG
jgi:metal-sulfur cluster biosynthetic enzyme